MAQPTQSQVHVDAVLTNISVAYLQNDNAFIGRRVFPIVPVEKQSDKYFTYAKNDWFRDEAQLRADGTASAGSGYGISTASYACDVYAIHKDVGDQVRANADAPIDPDAEATVFCTQRLMLRMEMDWMSKCFATSKWGTDVTGVASGATTGQTVHWSNYTSGDPIQDVETGKAKILGTTGFEPNTLVLGYEVFQKVKNHPDIVDRIKYSSTNASPAIASEQALAQLFGVDRVLVSRAVKATNIEGETAAYSFTAGKGALLAYVAPSPGLLTPSAGYTFAWRGASDGAGENIGVSRFRMDEYRADRIEAQMAWDIKVVATDLGYFFNTIIA